MASERAIGWPRARVDLSDQLLFSGIRKLTFHGNNFQDLPNEPLFGHTRFEALHTLNLSANYIVNVQSAALQGAPNIRVLDVRKSGFWLIGEHKQQLEFLRVQTFFKTIILNKIVTAKAPLAAALLLFYFMNALKKRLFKALICKKKSIFAAEQQRDRARAFQCRLLKAGRRPHAGAAAAAFRAFKTFCLNFSSI